MSRTRYRFIGRSGDRYIWESAQSIPGDSRVEQIQCSVSWFWKSRGVRRG